MNLIKSFMNFGAKPQELATIALGEFDLLRSELSPKSSLECIYNDSILFLREINQFSYEIVVQKVLDELEETNDDFNDELMIDDTISELSVQSKIKDKEWAFPISEKLEFFKKWNEKGEIVFIWNNILGDETDEKVQYIIDSSIDLDDIETFKEGIYRCEFATKFRKLPSQTHDDYLINRENYSNQLADLQNLQLHSELSNNSPIQQNNRAFNSNPDNTVVDLTATTGLNELIIDPKQENEETPDSTEITTGSSFDTENFQDAIDVLNPKKIDISQRIESNKIRNYPKR
ncbi:hypothetical protein TBLA_0G00330 [Henningerozyma blattae CBS 6284]|uniref:Vid27 N-terminal domain-containing protein n=1 Tax=Henningerozyma blattae (strain ATCC 34711 / CBS 6284 / DSM 70876 / NBRC 10599 / NRRL Y-10934 / UCD 77-7) TaxID=1071380 RepID=I2H6I0_HENB6|nr:hypothetical protein TBLA_0G00330 [Tetrapisispora blattae CBS 6284]CCH61982.1 hypothetical protein TBLA_0G00330 [Tetrapisispora blattae CBS 6284]